jgi:hypothetical protein
MAPSMQAVVMVNTGVLVLYHIVLLNPMAFLVLQ